MKRILFLILITLLISCTNQQTDQAQTESNETETESAAKTDIVPTIEDTSQVILMTSEDNAEKNLGVHIADSASNDLADLFRKGTTAYANDDFEGGVEIFEQFIEKDPTIAKAHYNLGVGLFHLNHFYDALQAFNKALEFNPEDPLALQYRGRSYYMLENFSSCLADYQAVVELTPEDPVAYYNRGTALGRTKDYLGAIKDFETAIELKPDYAEAYFNCGLANYFQGRLHEACISWNKAHDLGHFEAEKAIRKYCEGDKE